MSNTPTTTNTNTTIPTNTNKNTNTNKSTTSGWWHPDNKTLPPTESTNLTLYRSPESTIQKPPNSSSWFNWSKLLSWGQNNTPPTASQAGGKRSKKTGAKTTGKTPRRNTKSVSKTKKTK